VDLLLVVPQLILVAIFTPLVKGSGNILLLIVLLAAFNWMISARMVRGLAMGLRDREFVQAARYMGAPTWKIIAQHIIPNISSILIIDTTLNVGYAVLAETGLSYLGLGVQPPDVSLGSLIANETDSAFTYPWLFMFAGGLLVLVVLSANLVGDGLRDALDPTSRRARSRKVNK
jgi:peptide/nickel transport system permease protein